MKMLYEYSLRENPLYKLDPRAKLVFTLCVVLLSLFLPGVKYLAFLLLGIIGYGLVAGITPLDYRNIIILLIPFSVAIFTIQILYAGSEGPIYYLGDLRLPALGLENGAIICLRALILGISFALLMMMTHPMDITVAAVKQGVPFRYAYMIGFALRFLPLFIDEFAKIRQAQASRGLDEDRYGPLTKIISLPALLFPLIMDAMRRSADIALALEMRGLSTASKYGRTNLKDVEFKTVDHLVFHSVLLATLGLLLASFMGRLP